MMETLSKEPVHESSKMFDCEQCMKTFTSSIDLSTHARVKHANKAVVEDDLNQRKDERKSKRSLKTSSTKRASKNKTLIEYHQLEDKLYTFLGQLGNKMEENDLSEACLEEDLEKESVPYKVTVFSNYLENSVIRMPFDPQFPINNNLFQGLVPFGQKGHLFQSLAQDLLMLHSRLESEKTKWNFLDPAAQQNEHQLPYTLLEVHSLNATSQVRGTIIQFPETSIFLLWVAKVCKSDAWREIVSLVFIIRTKYEDFMFSQHLKKTLTSWKQFFTILIDRIKSKTITAVNSVNNLFGEVELINFLRLYSKWVTSINPF